VGNRPVLLGHHMRLRWDIFELSELEGFSMKEITAKTGAPVNTVLSRKYYAVLFLRHRLRELYDDVMGMD
jgi:DNA-directed RNA polymerase specialized sigma24 family protein